MNDNLMNFRVFYRQFGNKGKITNTTIEAENPNSAKKATKELLPKASIVAVFSVNKAKIA